jgi:hypothetical protein
MRSANSSLVGLGGGGAIRLRAGTPTAMKNSSNPGGTQTQSILAIFPDIFLKE